MTNGINSADLHAILEDLEELRGRHSLAEPTTITFTSDPEDGDRVLTTATLEGGAWLVMMSEADG